MKFDPNSKFVSVEPARFAEETKHVVWQKWSGPDDKIEKPKIQGFVDADGTYLMLFQDGRPVAFTFESVDDVLGLLAALKEEALKIRRAKRAEQQ